MAFANRDVCSARLVGVAASADRNPVWGHSGGAYAYVDRTSCGSVFVPRAVQFSPERENLHILGRTPWRSRHLPCFDSAAGRRARSPYLLRRRLRCGAAVTTGAGLDGGVSRTKTGYRL